MVAWLSLLFQRALTLRNESFRPQSVLRFVFLHDSHTVVSNKLYGYRIKPYEQLVSVSLTSCNASTSDLSTSWSRTTL